MTPDPTHVLRRHFVRGGAAGLFVAACGPTARPAEPVATSSTPGLARTPTRPPAPGASTPSATDPVPDGCGRRTEANIEGPFYRAHAPTREAAYVPGRADLAEDGRTGQAVTIAGRIVDARCQPYADALVEVWQADHQGIYDHEGFALRGQFHASPDGRYELRTILPGHYLNGDSFRPAHIHVKVHAPSRPSLTTQLYFAGDPYNDTDPFFVPSLLVTLDDNDDEDGRRRGGFDFVL